MHGCVLARISIDSEAPDDSILVSDFLQSFGGTLVGGAGANATGALRCRED
jgi:hypothetical protein